MCGLYGLITKANIKFNTVNLKKLMFHRGPDSFNFKILENKSFNKKILLAHSRLHIVGDTTCQPITVKTNSGGVINLIINGEIFNWKELSNELNYTCNQSDCEIIIPLYEKYIRNNKNDYTTFFKKINGQFSFVLYDQEYDKIFVSRDHVGITPLYIGRNNESIAISSEMKCLTESCGFGYFEIDIFLPRTYGVIDLKKKVLEMNIQEYLNYNKYLIPDVVEEFDILKIQNNIQEKLTNSVRLQLNDLL